MTFERPDLLALAPIVVLLVGGAIVSQWRRGQRLVDAYGGPDSAGRLLGRDLERFPAVRLVSALIAMVGLALAGAGPSLSPPVEVEPTTPIDLLVAVDVSHSMTGEDVAPSRIGRARDLVDEIVSAGVVDRVALSLFADWPFGLVPLTDDDDVIAFFTPWVSPQVIVSRDQGTSLSALVGHTRATWEERSRTEAFPIVLIVSDGEAHGTEAEVLDSIASVTEAGLRVWTAGTGSSDGAALFVSGSGSAPLLDGSGSPVVAGYDPELLRSMAELGGGSFFEIGDEDGVQDLVSELGDVRGSVAADEEGGRDLAFWLILLALALIVVEAGLDAGRLRGRRS